MRYLCVHCDKTFEHEDENKKPRCPECLRVNGLEKLAEPKKGRKGAAASAKAPPARPWLPWAIAGGVVLVLGIGYAVWANRSPSSSSGDGLSILDHDAVLAQLQHRSVEARELADFLVPNESVRLFGQRSAGSASGTQNIAAAVQQAIRRRAEAGAFETWSIGSPRDTPVALPSEVVEQLREDGAHHHFYPLELAALMTSALRARDVPAMVAEVFKFTGDRTPADPSGEFGYFVVAVYDSSVGSGTPHFYDPYGGRDVAPAEQRVLTDTQAIGQALNLRALHLLARESDPDRAMEASTFALRLDGRSAGIRASRAAVLVAAGQMNEGLQELEAAAQIRPDPPRRNLLGGVLFATDRERAEREINAALRDAPDYAGAHATLAALELARNDSDLALSELETAQRLDPELPMLPRIWAQYYATTNDYDRAAQYAMQDVDRNPNDWQAHLTAARIFRQLSRYEAMRREAHAVMDHTPPARRADMEGLIEQMLGPTALEAAAQEDSDDEEGDDLGSEGGAGGLRLDSPMLGGPGSSSGGSVLGGSRPSLLGGQTLGGPGLGGGGAPQLGGGGGEGGRLRLNINE